LKRPRRHLTRAAPSSTRPCSPPPSRCTGQLRPHLPPDYRGRMGEVFASGAEMASPWEDGRVVGVAVFRVAREDLQPARRALLRRPRPTDEARRSAGAGRAMVAYMERVGRSRGCDVLALRFRHGAFAAPAGAQVLLPRGPRRRGLPLSRRSSDETDPRGTGWAWEPSAAAPWRCFSPQPRGDRAPRRGREIVVTMARPRPLSKPRSWASRGIRARRPIRRGLVASPRGSRHGGSERIALARDVAWRRGVSDS